MKPIMSRPAVPLLLALGFAAGALPALSAALPAGEGGATAGTGGAAHALASYHVAQVTLSPMVQAPPTPEPEEEAAVEADGEGRPVSFSPEQAARGQESYDSVCEECHGDDLRGGLNGGAPLRGVSFEQRFAEGAPAAALFFYMSNLMPPEAPGRFSDSTYIDLMAYILQVNGFQSGAALPEDVDALAQLVMVK